MFISTIHGDIPCSVMSPSMKTSIYYHHLLFLFEHLLLCPRGFPSTIASSPSLSTRLSSNEYYMACKSIILSYIFFILIEI